MINPSLVYLAFASIMVVLSLVLIPRERYRVFLPVIFIATLFHSGLLYIAINIVEAWHYVADEPFSVFGIPIFILIAWGASLAIFLWGLPEKLPRWTHYIYITSFALAGTIIDAIFHSIGIRPYSEWFSGWMWFFPLFLIFWVTYILYRKRVEIEVT